MYRKYFYVVSVIAFSRGCITFSWGCAPQFNSPCFQSFYCFCFFTYVEGMDIFCRQRQRSLDFENWKRWVFCLGLWGGLCSWGVPGWGPLCASGGEVWASQRREFHWLATKAGSGCMEKGGGDLETVFWMELHSLTGKGRTWGAGAEPPSSRQKAESAL